MKSSSAQKSITSKKNTMNDSNTSRNKISHENETKQSLMKRQYSKDDMFLEFQRICNDLSNCSSYLEKTAIVKKLFKKGTEKDGFQSDVVLWCRLFLPVALKRIYNLQSKALIKLFSRILKQDEQAMLEDLEQGDVAETIKAFYEKSSATKPQNTSTLTLQEVDEFLEKLSTLTKEDEQIYHFKTIIRRCTADDLKMLIRLIKHDLRINAGPKHILGAVHDDAYAAFQVSQDLPTIVRRYFGISSGTLINSVGDSSASTSALAKSPRVASLALMTPVLPMLAEACKSVEMAMQKCSNGMLAEVKYDGERIQVHKHGNDFRYFSRSLKPVLAHKVNFLKEYIPKAFPHGDDLILDAEILLIDTRNGQPLPFGTLGVHKKAEFKDANVCLFIFDCIYYNGQSWMNRTMKERRQLLEEKMTPIKNIIVLSEVQEINDSKTLAELIVKVLKLGLEGLVLKDVNSQYEPGKRHWLKVKKDYLFEGAMADSADLVVLGAWYGTGQKGGIMSVFLMGCYDTEHDIWLTVTKVHTGHDDATLVELQNTLDMVKIGKDRNLVPRWLKANKPMIPDFVARDPKKQPVWEITGAEFTNQGVHTADGISIRFPRVTRIRDDKDWQTATNLQELRVLFNRSSESVDYSLLLGSINNKRAFNEDDEPTIKKKPKKPKPSDDKEHYSSEDINMEEDDEESVEKLDSKVKMEITEIDKHKEVRKRTSDKKKSPKKSLGKLMQCCNDNQRVKKEEETETSTSLHDVVNKKEKADFYSFIGTDYIEYNAAGSPLNWIEGRKPPKHLPKDAKPITERDETKFRSRCLLADVCVCLAKDLSYERRNILRRTLKTLGATILPKMEQSQATYVIHGVSQVPATILLENADVSKTARHVTESWIEATITHCKVQNPVEHAVTLTGVYCSCPCSHTGRANS
ncbi:DNA ligase 3 isoform X2 [Phymastichus coffea]|nr:DNA ligase 3 isoform X2 [Phymastichus coffea]